MLSQPKIEKWIRNNPVEADKFSKEVQKLVPNPANPQSITNPIGNAISQSWNWLTGGSTKKDNVQQQTKPPQPGDYKKDKNGLLVRKDAEKQIAPKVQYDQYISQYNTNQDGKPRGKIPPQLIGNIRSQGDAGANWVKQYDDLYKKRSEINKQIAADIKNGMTKQQLDQKYGDNLQNLNRNLNDHLGKVDDFSKGLKPLQQRNIKTYKTKPLVIDKGDKVTIDGKTYDKDFDADKIKKIIGNPGVGNQVKSVGGGQSGAVSGQKDKTPGATFGNPGVGNQVGTGAVSGGKTDATGKAKGQIGDLTGQEIDIKGQSIGTTGVGQGAQAGTKGEVGAVTQNPAQTLNPAITRPIVTPRTIAPPFTIMPPPGTQVPNLQTRKYDSTKDKDIIYKGKVAPKRISKFKGTRSDPTTKAGQAYYDKLLKKFS